MICNDKLERVCDWFEAHIMVSVLSKQVEREQTKEWAVRSQLDEHRGTMLRCRLPESLKAQLVSFFETVEEWDG